MSLAERLQQIREGSAERIPAEIRETMHRTTQALIDSGQAERAVGVGAAAPEFALAGPEGEVSLSGLRAAGPVMLTWFRGSW